MISSENLTQFRSWMDAATATEQNDPNAMFLATIDPNGVPNIRTVLLKSVDEDGFVFFTNFESVKGRELLRNRSACLYFLWKTMQRQVKVQGYVEIVSEHEADRYFQSRPRLSRIGAWASQQSCPLRSRSDLQKEVAKLAIKFGVGMIPRPKHWGGFRLLPSRICFYEA